MHKTVEAVVEADGQIHLLESVELPTSTRLLVTILDEPNRQHPFDKAVIPKLDVDWKQPGEKDFEKLIESLSRFPDDFMEEGREQPPMQDRGEYF